MSGCKLGAGAMESAHQPTGYWALGRSVPDKLLALARRDDH